MTLNVFFLINVVSETVFLCKFEVKNPRDNQDQSDYLQGSRGRQCRDYFFDYNNWHGIYVVQEPAVCGLRIVCSLLLDFSKFDRAILLHSLFHASVAVMAKHAKSNNSDLLFPPF